MRAIDDEDEYDFSSEVKIDKILTWARENKFYDTSFVGSLWEQMKRGSDLTSCQVNILDKIIEKFKIDDCRER